MDEEHAGVNLVATSKVDMVRKEIKRGNPSKVKTKTIRKRGRMKIEQSNKILKYVHTKGMRPGLCNSVKVKTMGTKT